MPIGSARLLNGGERLAVVSVLCFSKLSVIAGVCVTCVCTIQRNGLIFNFMVYNRTLLFIIYNYFMP